MAKKSNWKNLIIFWIAAILLLAGWYAFLQVKYRNIGNLKPISNILPVGSERRGEIKALVDIYSEFSGPPKAGEASEKTLLVLFQNDMELRPGGGFIGAFGVVKVKDGKIADIQVFDTGNFDKNIPNTEKPPVPLKEILGTEFWKMRDSNWSPDFKTNAEKAEYFYKLGGGPASASTDAKAMAGEKATAGEVDGVIAINTRVLDSILEITGPVKIDGYPGEYRDENAVLQLEYQVEKGYLEQGIEKSERKNIMAELADILAEKAHNFTFSQQLRLAQRLEMHLKQKDIQLFFRNDELQKIIEKVGSPQIGEQGWDGRMKDSDGDYLMAVDANLLALKSDYCIKRKMNYQVDLTGEAPQAVLDITYEHTCRAKDWMTSDYRSWLRIYAPEGSFLTEANGQNGDVHPPTNMIENEKNYPRANEIIGEGVKYSEELGKKVFGMLIYVPVGQTKTVSLKYRLPESVKTSDYHLLVQKQSGSGDVPIEISVRKPDGSEMKANEILNGDKYFPL